MSNEPTNIPEELQAIEIAASRYEVVSQISKVEIDMQISTAQAFPRHLPSVKKDILDIATSSIEIAESCSYALPRAGKVFSGPSVRFAEIVASQYGNLRIGTRVVENDGKTITVHGICHDLQKNNSTTVEVKRSILQWETKWNPVLKKSERTGKQVKMSEDMQVITGNAACAIAYRNVLFKVVPTAIFQEIYEQVKEVAKGDAKTVTERRMKAVEYFGKLGITPEHICKVLEIKDIEEIGLELLAVLNGMRSAYKNGESQLSELFPKEEPTKEKATTATDQALKDITSKATKK